MLRLKAAWQAQYDAWRRRDLADVELVYLWADGLYVKAGLEDTKAALLVLIGALADGRKVVLCKYTQIRVFFYNAGSTGLRRTLRRCPRADLPGPAAPMKPCPDADVEGARYTLIAYQ